MRSVPVASGPAGSEASAPRYRCWMSMSHWPTYGRSMGSTHASAGSQLARSSIRSPSVVTISCCSAVAGRSGGSNGMPHVNPARSPTPESVLPRATTVWGRASGTRMVAQPPSTPSTTADLTRSTGGRQDAHGQWALFPVARVHAPDDRSILVDDQLGGPSLLCPRVTVDDPGPGHGALALATGADGAGDARWPGRGRVGLLAEGRRTDSQAEAAALVSSRAAARSIHDRRAAGPPTRRRSASVVNPLPGSAAADDLGFRPQVSSEHGVELIVAERLGRRHRAGPSARSWRRCWRASRSRERTVSNGAPTRSAVSASE